MGIGNSRSAVAEASTADRQSHTNIMQEVEVSIQQAVGQSQTVIREEMESAAKSQNDRISAVEQNIHEMDNKLKLAKEERKKAEANMKRSITEADKKLEAFKIRMQHQQDTKLNIMEKKMKQQQELMKMQFKQQQEILDKKMMHSKECADRKLELLNKLEEKKATSTSEEYNKTLLTLLATNSLETDPVPYEGNPPICIDELERERNYDEEGQAGWFDHFDVDSPKPAHKTAPVKLQDYTYF